jgi:hypothetical protein
LSEGGGVLTGHVEAIAGASGSQIPRVSEVVKKAGDQMSGPLIVPELRGPSNEIVIPVGHRIKGAESGTIVAPGMVIQTLYKQVDTITTYAAGANTTVILDAFDFSITPKYSNSKILLTFDVSFESASHQMVFRLTRNGTAIGNNSTVALNGWVGWKNGPYDSNDSTTPQSRVMTYLDSPATTSACAYKLLVIGSAANALTFYLNRSVSTAGTSDNENGTSSVMLQEIAQ